MNRDVVPLFEERLRAELASQDKEWLVEQIVRLSLDAHSLEEKDRRLIREEEDRRRSERLEQVRAMELDRDRLQAFLDGYGGHDRERLTRDGLLSADAPPKGTALIEPGFRSEEGEALLAHAKDMLFGLLFGDESTGTRLDRRQRELLTLVVPRAKSDALDFMRATTELSALGTWHDPKGAAHDERADNIVMQVEYGEVEGELVGHGVVLALGLINNLEINEEVLYGRMENIEQSTLVT